MSRRDAEKQKLLLKFHLCVLCASVANYFKSHRDAEAQSAFWDISLHLRAPVAIFYIGSEI